MAYSRSVNRRKQNGYTLIELLLVVTVLALIAALAVKTYRDKAQTDRINIAALDLQHVLEAGMAYNVANTGSWPEANSATPCVKASTTDTFTTDYLPNSSNQSNYGTYFCWSGDDPTYGKQKAKRFWVAMPITDNDLTTATNTAKRIAARLPNAVATGNPADNSTTPSPCTTSACYVRAEVSVPSASSTLQNTYIAGSGNCDPSIANNGGVNGDGQQPGIGTGVFCKRTTLGEQFSAAAGSSYTDNDSLSQYEIDFQCKPGETAHVNVTPNFLKVDRYSKPGLFAENIYQLSGMANDSSDCVSTNGQVKCTVNMMANVGAQGSAAALTIGCKDEYSNPGNFSGTSLCVCGSPWNTDKSKPYTGCPDQTGAIGASYVAVCGPAAAPPTSLVNNAADKSFW